MGTSSKNKFFGPTAALLDEDLSGCNALKFGVLDTG